MSQALAELKAEFERATGRVGDAYVHLRGARTKLKDALLRRQSAWQQFSHQECLEVGQAVAALESPAPGNPFRSKREGLNV